MIPIWGFCPSYILNELQVLQNRCLRNVYEIHPRADRIQMFLKNVENHLPVRGICLLRTAMAMYKSISGHTHSNLTFNRAGDHCGMKLRNRLKLRPQASRTSKNEKSFLVIGPRIFNKVPDHIKSSRRIADFRSKLNSHLKSETFIESCFNNNFFDLKF